jgi:cytochrome oxidase assembly protein ShyY1
MVRSIETSTIGRVLDLDLAGYHLQLPGGQPGSLEPTPIPEVEAGSYLSYGLQWLAFGVLARIGLG